MKTKAPEPRVTTTITLSPEVRDRADAMAAREGLSRSWVVERALREFLETYAVVRETADV